MLAKCMYVLNKVYYTDDVIYWYIFGRYFLLAGGRSEQLFGRTVIFLVTAIPAKGAFPAI